MNKNEETNDVDQKQFIKCPFCTCLFLTDSDLQKHLSCMGNSKEEHLEFYRNAHGRIEHGSSNME